MMTPPSDEEIVWLLENDRATLEHLHMVYEDRIRWATEDPLNLGFELDGWTRIREGLYNSNEVLVLGGNRSGKTTGCAKIVMEAVTKNNDGHVVCFSQNADTSVKVQQAAIWEMMPKEFRKKTKSIEGYINFSMQNGFTGSSFIFPDTRTRVDFKTYTQFTNNQTILEGFEFGFKQESALNVGTWLDEYLGDATLVNTLRFRLATRNSKLLIGFTPIDGYTPFISDYLQGAETRETRKAELLNNKSLPIKQYSPKRDASVVYLHSDENPFGGYERIAKDLEGRPEDEILVRAYGVPVKSMTTLLPLFNTEVNVLGKEPNRYGMSFPDISNQREFTTYMVVDPAGARNYTAIWAGVDKDGIVYMKIKPYERIGDSRFFAKENENNEDLFRAFDDYNMNFIASDGRMEEVGINALDEWFSYNPNVPIDKANRPMCYIHEDCGNLIDSLINYGSKGKADEALKDFFDVIRYLRMTNGGEGPNHVMRRQLETTMNTKGGY